MGLEGIAGILEKLPGEQNPSPSFESFESLSDEERITICPA